jgi:ABC-type transport system substrate-binding protein
MISHGKGGLIQGYWNLPKVDAAWDKLITLTSLEELDNELRTLNRDVYKEFSFHPVVMRNQVAVAGPRVKGWTPSSYGFAWHLETVKRADL